MNTVWSEQVQGVMTLYLSRKLRFDDVFFEQYAHTFALERDAALNILEIGCGPGALAEALHRWYPNACITAIDRDSNFISFAEARIAGVEFREGDATQLPFADGSFDLTISNTVHEHVEPEGFWGEQRRVLKLGGVCLCLSVRKSIRSAAPCLKETDAEKAIWEQAAQTEETPETLQVGRWRLSEAELPAVMEAHGFSEVTTGYALLDLTPDAPKYLPEMAERMIEADRWCEAEAAQRLPSGMAAKLLPMIHARYDERLRLYRAGQRQWDTNVCVTIIVRGVKR